MSNVHTLPDFVSKNKRPQKQNSIAKEFVGILLRRGIPIEEIKSASNNSHAMHRLARWFNNDCPSNGLCSDEIDLIEIYQQILGNHFILPFAVSQIFEKEYLPDQRKQLEKTLPDIHTISSFKKNGFALLPGSPISLSFESICDRIKNSFGYQHIQGLDDLDQTVFNKVLPPSGWIALKTIDDGDMLHLKLSEQTARLNAKERLASTEEVLYAMYVFSTIHGLNLFSNNRVRTQTLNDDKYPVCLRTSGGKISICTDNAPEEPSLCSIAISHDVW